MSTREREMAGEAAVDERDDDVFDLVIRLQDGERSALAEAYDRHHGALRAFARRLLADASAAEDLVHDVFLALPSAIHRFEGRASLRSFLLGIAARLCHKHVRSAVRARRASKNVLAREVTPAVPLPSERSLGTELAVALERALDTLAVEQRVAFTLCALEERSSREAAEILGVNEITVRTRLSRAREKLRAQLEREGLA